MLLGAGPMCEEHRQVVSWSRRRARFVEQRPCSVTVARSLEQFGGVEEATARCGRTRRRREPEGLLVQLSGRSRGAASGRSLGSPLEGRGRNLVGLGGGEGEVTSTFLDIRHDLRKTGVEQPAP